MLLLVKVLVEVEEEVAVVEEDIRISNQLLSFLNLAPKCTKPCPICSELHWQRHCPSVISAKESHEKDSKSKQGKDNNDKVRLTFSRESVDVDGQVLKIFSVEDNNVSHPSAITLHINKQAKTLSLYTIG